MIPAYLAPPERFELPTPRSEDECSDPLSYGGTIFNQQPDYIIHNYMIKLSEMTRTKKILIIGYVVFAVLASLYVKGVLKKEDLSLMEDEKTNVEKIFEVTVTLKYFDGKKTTEYKKVMENIDCVDDLLKEIREDDGLEFEKTLYTYGIEIESVNRMKPPENFKWVILSEDEDITNKIEKVKLNKNDTFELKMIEK